MMRAFNDRTGVLALAMAVGIGLSTPSALLAQHRGDGGRGDGGRGSDRHGGGDRDGGDHRGGEEGRHGGGRGAWSEHGSDRSGDYRGREDARTNSSWNGRGDFHYGNPGRASGNVNVWSGPRHGNLSGVYGSRYSSGYRGSNYGRPGYGAIGLGTGYGNYGYGNFPWYSGLTVYGGGVSIGRGYGSNYSGNSAPVVIERYREPNQAENDYVPQLNTTTAQLGSLVDGGAVLGVTMDPEYPNAAVVRQVIPGSSAEKAGLRAGDMITSMDKKEIHSPADVSNVVIAMQPGDQIEIQFVRPILRSEVKEAAPETGLEGVTPSPEAVTPVPPPVPQPSPSS